MPRKSRPAPVEDPVVFQVLNEIGIIDQLARHKAGQVLAPELNMAQFIVLNHFARLGGECSLVRLADAMQVTKGAMTNTVSRLRAKGLIEVRRDPEDGRGKLVTLNARGRKARDLAVKKLGLVLADLRGVASSDELGVALATLRRLRVWFDRNR